MRKGKPHSRPQTLGHLSCLQIGRIGDRNGRGSDGISNTTKRGKEAGRKEKKKETKQQKTLRLDGKISLPLLSAPRLAAPRLPEWDSHPSCIFPSG